MKDILGKCHMERWEYAIWPLDAFIVNRTVWDGTSWDFEVQAPEVSSEAIQPLRVLMGLHGRSTLNVVMQCLRTCNSEGIKSSHMSHVLINKCCGQI